MDTAIKLIENEDPAFSSNVLRWLSTKQISKVAEVLQGSDKLRTVFTNALIFAQNENTQKSLLTPLIKTYDDIEKENLIKSIGSKISYPIVKSDFKIKSSEEKLKKAIQLSELCRKSEIPLEVARTIIEEGLPDTKGLPTPQMALHNIFLKGYFINTNQEPVDYDAL